MPIHKTQSFKSGQLYNLTSTVQKYTLLNRGLIDIGGCAIPQAIMSNNKDEAIERCSMSMIYFMISILMPLALLPIFNKRFLAKNNIVSNFKNNEKRIIEVSKKFLTKDGKYLEEGVRKTADMLLRYAKDSGNSKKIESAKTIAQDFENVLSRFPDKEVLRQKLLNAHEKIYHYDFLSTSLLWCLTPWTATEITERRTHKKGFSATFNMGDVNSKINEKEYNRKKRNKLIATFLVATIPAFIIPKLLMKGIGMKSDGLSAVNGLIKKAVKKLKENAANFDYDSGVSMSKTIFALMWAVCDYPATLISSRDKNELRDRSIRSGALFAMFFGGDFMLNNIFGRMLDKFAGTQLMNKKNISPNAGFFKRFKLMPKSLQELADMSNLGTKALNKNKTLGASLYWFSLLANMGLIGFALPAILNGILKKSVQKNQEHDTYTKRLFEPNPVFGKFKID